MSYENYTLEDFLTSKAFKSWVLNPDVNDHLFWGKWIESHPEQKDIILKARQLILSYRFKEGALVSEGEQEDILESILRKSKTVKKESRTNRFFLYGAAASLLLVFFYIAVSFLSPEKPIEEVPSRIVKQNPAGQKSTIRLPDGSKVWLNSASKLEYAEDFVNGRVITLSGEAYFEVKSDLERPFKVMSGNIVTTAYGTSFNVKAFKAQQKIEVLLVSGEVSIGELQHEDQETKSIFIKPGEQAIYDFDSDVLRKTIAEDNSAILWKKGIISFRKANFKQIKKELERWYGVKIKARDQYRELHYTGDFDNESLERVLERMAFTERFTFEIKKNEVIIEFESKQ